MDNKDYIKNKIQLVKDCELHVIRNDEHNFIAEIWQVIRHGQGGSTTTPLGHVFTFYNSKLTAESTRPHWVAEAYINQEFITKELTNTIGETLLKQTSCKEPFSLSVHKYLPYQYSDEKIVDGAANLQKGNIWLED